MVYWCMKEQMEGNVTLVSGIYKYVEFILCAYKGGKKEIVKFRLVFHGDGREVIRKEKMERGYDTGPRL